MLSSFAVPYFYFYLNNCYVLSIEKVSCVFSATRVTAKVANDLAEAVGADVFEIQPAKRYTEADLNWKDEKSRSTLEMNDTTARPQIAAKLDYMDEYDVIYVGFPIWWYVAPRIINTFLESYDLTGKTVIPLLPPVAAVSRK